MNTKNYVVGDDAEAVDVDLDADEVRLADGTRLTEARAEEIAAKALAEARRRNLIPGGKSLSGDGAHSPRVQVRVSADVHRAAVDRAEAEGVSLSALVRRALERYLAA